MVFDDSSHTNPEAKTLNCWATSSFCCLKKPVRYYSRRENRCKVMLCATLEVPVTISYRIINPYDGIICIPHLFAVEDYCSAQSDPFVIPFEKQIKQWEEVLTLA